MGTIMHGREAVSLQVFHGLFPLMYVVDSHYEAEIFIDVLAKGSIVL
jgi:hypothetical protein